MNSAQCQARVFQELGDKFWLSGSGELFISGGEICLLLTRDKHSDSQGFAAVATAAGAAAAVAAAAAATDWEGFGACAADFAGKSSATYAVVTV